MCPVRVRLTVSLNRAACLPVATAAEPGVRGKLQFSLHCWLLLVGCIFNPLG